MVVKGQDVDNIELGDTLTDDGFRTRTLRLTAVQPAVRRGLEHPAEAGHRRARAARLRGPVRPGSAAGVRRVTAVPAAPGLQDAARKDGEGGGRLAIVLNGSPLFTGGAGSGESNIRQWIIENDLLEAIVALPTDMFYNTGISHLHLDPRQRQARQAQGQGAAHRRRRHVRQDAQVPRLQAQRTRPKDIERICHLYDSFRNEHGTDEHPAHSKIFKREEFVYPTITVERPLQLRSPPPRTNRGSPGQEEHREAQAGRAGRDPHALTGLVGWEWKDRDEFITELKDALRKAGLTKPPAPLIKTIWSTIGEHDDDANIVTDSKGNPEPDPRSATPRMCR